MIKTTHALAVPAALLLAVGLAACGGSSIPVASSSSGSSDSSESSADKNDSSNDNEGESVSSFDLQVGDCFTDMGPDSSETNTNVSDVNVVDCSQPHLFEVYNNYEITTATMPVGQEREDLLYEACYDSFTEYVGVTLEESEYNVQTLEPTATSWAQGDHTLTCLVTSADGSQFTGSAKGANK